LLPRNELKRRSPVTKHNVLEPGLHRCLHYLVSPDPFSFHDVSDGSPPLTLTNFADDEGPEWDFPDTNFAESGFRNLQGDEFADENFDDGGFADNDFADSFPELEIHGPAPEQVPAKAHIPATETGDVVQADATRAVSNPTSESRDIPNKTPDSLSEDPRRLKLRKMLLCLFSRLKQDESDDEELNNLIQEMYEKEKPELEKSMGATLFQLRDRAISRWIDMRRRIRSIAKGCDFKGDLRDGYEHVMGIVEGGTFEKSYGALILLTGLDEWRVEMKREGKWVEERFFNEDVASVLNHVCRCEMLNKAGGFLKGVEVYNSVFPGWFGGKVVWEMGKGSGEREGRDGDRR